MPQVTIRCSAGEPYSQSNFPLLLDTDTWRYNVTSIIEQYATRNQLHVSHHATKHPHDIHAMQTLEMELLLIRSQYKFLNSGPRSPESRRQRSQGAWCRKISRPHLPRKIVPIGKGVNATFENRVPWHQVQLGRMDCPPYKMIKEWKHWNLYWQLQTSTPSQLWKDS